MILCWNIFIQYFVCPIGKDLPSHYLVCGTVWVSKIRKIPSKLGGWVRSNVPGYHPSTDVAFWQVHGVCTSKGYDARIAPVSTFQNHWWLLCCSQKTGSAYQMYRMKSLPMSFLTQYLERRLKDESGKNMINLTVTAILQLSPDKFNTIGFIELDIWTFFPWLFARLAVSGHSHIGSRAFPTGENVTFLCGRFGWRIWPHCSRSACHKHSARQGMGRTLTLPPKRRTRAS